MVELERILLGRLLFLDFNSSMMSSEVTDQPDSLEEMEIASSSLSSLYSGLELDLF